MKPLISVIIPVYNTADYLKQCLDSIINQTYHNLEVICIDDGSTDASSEILDLYEALDSRIKCIHRENRGLVNARKTGITLSSGKYVMHVDSDDWIDDDMCEILVRDAEENSADIVTCGAYREYIDKTVPVEDAVLPGIYSIGNNLGFLCDRIIDTSYIWRHYFPPFLWGKLYNKDFILPFQLRLPDIINHGEDTAVTIPALLKSRCVCVKEKKFYHYRFTETSMTNMVHRNCDKEKDGFLELKKIISGAFREIRGIYKNMDEQCQTILDYYGMYAYWDKLFRLINGKLCPFNNILISDRVLLYGAGRFGHQIRELLNEKGITCVGWVDKRNSGGILSSENINSIYFDKVLIAVLSGEAVNSITHDLIQRGVNSDKISIIDTNQIREAKLW